jgi:hypothetical protein
MGYVLQYHDITALAVVIEFNLAQHVPLDSEISFKELSLVSGAPLGRLERILRLLFVRRIFHEPRPGYIAHTTASERLVTNPELTAFLGHCTHEAFPAASRLVDSLRKYPNTEEPSQAGFNVAFGTEDPLFTFLTKNPDRFERFNQGMAGLSKSGGRSVKQVVEGFPWGELGEATVVDVCFLYLLSPYPSTPANSSRSEAATATSQSPSPRHTRASHS